MSRLHGVMLLAVGLTAGAAAGYRYAHWPASFADSVVNGSSQLICFAHFAGLNSRSPSMVFMRRYILDPERPQN